MPDPNEIVEMIAGAGNWDARVAMIRRIPEAFGTAEHANVYAAIARHVYVPKLTPEFAYVHWRDEYELNALERTYTLAQNGTNGFRDVTRDQLAQLIEEEPATLRVFRLLLGLTGVEFSEASLLVAEQLNLVRYPRVPSKTQKNTGVFVRTQRRPAPQ